ncbi:MAG: biotin--[acetyl-CoA-carboxylase] ligase [Alphaproteobacteria bacterium]
MSVTLSAAALAAGHHVVSFAEIGSTNSEALERAARGTEGPLWLVADRQNAGRGRRGRTWMSEPGNLFATLLLTDPSPQAKVAELCFVAALALDDALLTLAPEIGTRFLFKWPNDGLLDGAKIAGILVEATSRGPSTSVAIGIGVNIAHHPTDTPYRTTSLNAAGLNLTRDQLFEALSASMVRALAVWRRGEGFAAIRAGWLARAAGLGGPLRITTEGRLLEGIFAGVDADGQLILDTPDGRRFVTAGEVILPFEARTH